MRNSQIHLRVRTELREKLLEESNYNELSMNELCIQKLNKSSQLNKIEIMLEEVLRRVKFN